LRAPASTHRAPQTCRSSGAVYGQTTLKALRLAGVETHLVISRSGQITIAHELKIKVSDLSALADVTYRVDDIGAAISSGSFPTMGMLVAPCSIRTLAEIACGVTSSLLTRAADVVLKERRRLVLMVRETPFHLGHLRSMTQVTEMGAIVMPPVPAFYPRPPRSTILSITRWGAPSICLAWRTIWRHVGARRSALDHRAERINPVCTESAIRADDVTESPKLAE
jgi:4-hydroxy-3-polyprenylbenzoate decarboxylase